MERNSFSSMKLYSAAFIFLLSLFCYAAALIQSPPRIVKQPSTEDLLVYTQSNYNDIPFFIECEAEGEPSPKYRWIKNGQSFNWQTYDDRILQQPGRGTLVFTNFQDFDVGQYQCFAENALGVATSNSVFVRKSELHSFKDVPPLKVTGTEGEPFKLSCEAPYGIPLPKIYWLIQYTDGGFKSINNSRITLDPDGTLWFSSLAIEDASYNFMYACAATSASKLEYKLGHRILLNVISSSTTRLPPALQYATKANEMAKKGKAMELFCIFSGTPLPHIVWSKNNKVIKQSDNIIKENYGKSLVIKSVEFNDEGIYTCAASNGVGENLTHSINLTVVATPYFITEPEFINTDENEYVEFHCVASGIPKPEIKWLHNGRPIEQTLRNPRRKVEENRIVIENVTKTDTGNYGCNATNSLGYIYKDVYINVLTLPPEMTGPLTDREVVVAQDITLNCNAIGVPKPYIKWFLNDTELIGDRFIVSQKNGDLHIKNVMYEDSGQYKCNAENKFGECTAEFTLTVQKPIQIITRPEDIEVQVGTSVAFQCNAQSTNHLSLEIKWLRDGKVIDFDREPRFFATADHSLSISKTTDLDSGTYTCVAKTPYDQEAASASLIVIGVPDPPIIKNILCNKKEAVISWEPRGDNGAPIIQYNIQSNTSFSPDVWETLHNNIPSSNLTYTFPLSPWVGRSFRITAWNKAGSSKSSYPSKMCKPDPDVPYKNPDNVQGEGSQPDNLVIQWTPMSQIQHNGPGFRYRVYYKRNGEEANVYDVMDWRQNHLVINDQPSYQPYRIKVTALNSLGEANVAPVEVIGYSGENEPLEAPTNFRLANISSPTSALLTWDPVSTDSIRGHFKGYKIKTWLESKQHYRETKVPETTQNTLLKNLVPFEKNYVQICVYNNKYNGPPSETISFAMPEAEPGPVSSLYVKPLGSTGLYLKWEKPRYPNGIITGYNVYYGTWLEERILRRPLIRDPNQLQAKLVGLKPNTNYLISVTAINAAGESSPYFEEIETRNAEPTVPSVPNFKWEYLTAKKNTTNVKVTWLPNFNGNPGSNFYVQYKKKNDETYLSTVPEFDEDYVVIRGLEFRELYEFVLVAFDCNYRTKSAVQEVYVDKEPT